MRRPAYVSALLLLTLGLMALAVPQWFVAIVAAMQEPPMLYVAALLRFGVGVTFLLAYESSRGRLALFFLGIVMVMGGIATPFIGHGLARPILDAWLQGGVAVVRGWGVGASLLATGALFALRPRLPRPMVE
jgi:hypothetical protein